MCPLIAFEPMRLIPYAIYGLAAVLTLAVLPKLPDWRNPSHEETDKGGRSASSDGWLAGERILMVDNQGAHEAVMLPAGAHVCCRLDALEHCVQDNLPAMQDAVSRRSGDSGPAHCLDERIKSVDQVMADSYAPTSAPLGVMPHGRSERPSVAQRYNDIRTLITHTVDPLLSEYFRDFGM